MSNIDLHIHSNCSDGSDCSEDLIQNILNSEIEIFALTDHDTIEGCSKVARLIDKNVKFIPSVELTCIAGDIKCHILGYNCDYNNKKLLQLIEKGKILRKNKLETRIKYLKDIWDIELTKEELNWLYSRKSVVKTHLANILVNRGLEKDNVSAMKKYLDGCKAGDTRFSIEEAIESIISAGGIPVWAHPLGGEGEEHDCETIFIKNLNKMTKYKIQGLECYYSRYNMQEIDMLIKYANEYNLLISGGSDYHGSNKNGIKLGMLNTENLNINKENLTILNKIL